MMLEWLKLVRTPGLGPARIGHLLRYFGGAKAILEASDKAWEQVPGIRLPFLQKILRRRQEVPSAPIHQELDRLTDMKGEMLILGDPGYPPLLQEIHHPPPVLFALGNPELLMKKNTLAVVGSRKASHFGRQFAHRLAINLAQNGLITVSGMAIGIDAAAHRGALEAEGLTIAVLATGLDVLYPPSHARLRQHIIDQGCLVTEAPMGTPPAAHLFPPRNRIISGLCRGVAIIEAGLRSGSLITARLALEQGREVFAVPAQAGDPRHLGSNDLLRRGATYLEDINDVLQNFAWDIRAPDILSPQTSGPTSNLTTLPAKKNVPENTESATVHAMLRDGPVQGDELARRCHLTVASLSRILLQLELVGVVQRLPGNQFALRQM